MDQTKEERIEQIRKQEEWRMKNFREPSLKGLGGRHPGDEINLFYALGNYTIEQNEVESYNYDYSFITGKF